MKEPKIEPGTKLASPEFKITVTAEGPYLVYGAPPIARQYIMLNENKEAWYYKKGRDFLSKKQVVALCRCGASSNKPFCDGSHLHSDWSPQLTADNIPILDEAKVYEGARVSITDNEKYCASARFCMANGGVWDLITRDDETSENLAVRESNYCPAGRLSAWENGSDKPIEPFSEPSLGLIEDPSLHLSGPIWVKGGIPISKDSGETYEVRNRVTLCRCGKSANKPFCDGAHCTTKFRDAPFEIPEGEETA